MVDSAVAPLPNNGALVGTELFYVDNGVIDANVTANQLKTFTGDVHGPASATDNAIARFDGTTGKLLQNSAVFVSDGGGLVVGDPALEAMFWNGTLGLQSTGLSSNQIGLGLSAFGAGFSPIIEMGASRGSAIHTQTILQANDIIAKFTFSGSDGNAFQEAAGIDIVVDGTPGSGDMPGRIVFSTTPSGSVGAVERMRIANDGQVNVGQFLNVGTGGVQTNPPTSGGSHWPFKLEYDYSNAQLEGTVFEFAGGLTSFVSGHKTSGTGGNVNALINNAEIEIDSGATIRTLQCQHSTGRLTGDGRSLVGMQGFTMEATIDLDDTVGRCGYVSAMEVYSNINTCGIMDSNVYGFVSQCYTGASCSIPLLVAGTFANVISSPAVIVDSVVVEVNLSAGPGSAMTTSKGISLTVPGAGGTVANHTALWIGDQSGFGSTTSYNINSKGDNSKNVFDGYIINTGKTVASLMSAATAGAGARSFVNDSTVAASGNFGAIVAGGSTNKVPVHSDGTNWRIG